MGSYASRASFYGWFAALVIFWILPLAARGSSVVVLDSVYGNSDTDPSSFASNPYTLAQGPGNVIYIYASGGENVSAVALNVEIGGEQGSLAGNDFSGTNPGGPKITGVQMLGISDGSQSGIFDAAPSTGGLNTGYAGFTSTDTTAKSQFWNAYVTVNSGSVLLPTTPQLLAVVTIDTTGVMAGTQWALNLDSNVEPSFFTPAGGGQDKIQVVDGLIVIGNQAVPEPASIGLLGFGALGLLRRRRNVPANASA